MRGEITVLVMLLGAFVSKALEPNYTLPPITYETEAEKRVRLEEKGRRLMALKGIPDGDATLVCTNWICPTSIVVNAVRYDVVTNWLHEMIDFDIMTTNVPSRKIARGTVEMSGNGLEARLSAFVEASLTSLPLAMYAQGVSVQPIDPATNMMFLTYVPYSPYDCQRLVYKSIYVHYFVMNVATNSIATNALVFTSELINAGLPESERITLPTEQQEGT